MFWKSPLLFCYGNDAYIPREGKYDSEWVRAQGIDKCECTDKDENEALLKALVKVVGFLNEVNLYNHPPGANGKDCGNSQSSATATECTATPNGTSCTYEVHQYWGKSVRVKVTCSDVAKGNGSCYKKLTHEPVGFNGTESAKAGAGFRLGDVVYNGNGENGIIKYYSENGTTSNGSSQLNRYKPLVSVSAYFYNGDTNYKDPLLVELQFKNGKGKDNCKDGDGAGTVCEYYKLKTTIESGNMTWAKVEEDQTKQFGVESKLLEYLNELRYGFKKIIRIEIQWNTKDSKYPLKVRDAKPGGLNEFGPIKGAGGNQVKVEDCTEKCPQLTSAGYRCFQHQISTIDGDFDYNQVGGVAFTIPGANGSVIEIPLFNGATEPPDCNNGQPGKIDPLTYNKCMDDVYVFFYNKGGGGKNPDTVPLMLWYNYGYYAPCNRDEYFTRWVKVTVPGVDGQKPPCEGDGGTELVVELEKVNRALNRIDLDPDKLKSILAKPGTSSGYGLPDQGTGSGSVSVDRSKFPTDRVKLTRQEGPIPTGSPAYYRVVHRTVNGFTIGDIMYAKQDFATSGVKINGGVTIEVKKNGGKPAKTHKELATKNKWNTVVAYYSTSDRGLQLPQLIVILRTDSEVSSKPIKASESEKSYEYYILTNNGGVNYEYVWHPVTNYPPKQTPVTLDDKTDFSLLNSIVILLEMKNNGNKYGDSEIKPAISNAIKNQPYISSPGRSNGINRIKGKEITVSDETAGTCLSKAGFKLITHDIGKLVTLDGQLGKVLKTVKLIAGLRFLIPTIIKGSYRQLKVLDSGTSGAGNGTELFLFYKPNGDENNDKICLFFYDKDPRPLMLCYAGSAYIPMYKITYFRIWYRYDTIKNCACKGTGNDCNNLLDTLVEVSNFINPVYINRVPRGNCTFTSYYLHRFNGKWIKMYVDYKKPKNNFCYNKYIHTPDEGHRLGTIYYGCNCIQLKDNGSKNVNCITSALNGEPPGKHKSSDQVVVFYYKHDNDHKYPMVVAMGTTNGRTTKCKLYYTLVDKANKVYKKHVETEFNLDNNDEVTKKLDDALFGTSNKLQLIIDRRPIERLYCPKPLEQQLPNGKTVEYKPFQCKERQNGKQGTPGKTGSPSTDVIPPSYEAKLYNNDRKPLTNGSTPKTIQVTQVKCDQLSLHGYRCYVHKVTDVTGVEEIGGLKFYLWDNTVKGQGGTNCGASASGPGSSNCPSTGNAASTSCRELCLYKTSGASPEEQTILKQVVLIPIHYINIRP